MLKRTNVPNEIPLEQLSFLKPHIRHLPGASEEMQRQEAERQRGERLFNQALADIKKDPIGTANLLATADVQRQIEQVKHRLDTISTVTFNHACRSDEQLETLLENNQGLDQKLTTLIENNQEVRKQLLIVTENIKKQAENKSIQENYQGLLDASLFVQALGQHLGNKDISRMATIAHTAATISKSVEALQAGMTFPASLTPMSAIGMSVLSLITAFAKKGPNINQIMLDAIQSLAQQLDTFRKEMHERLDKIDNKLAKIYLRIIDGFCELLNQNKDMMEILTDIQNFLRDFKFEVKDYFSTVNENLRSIEDHLHVTGRHNKIENIYKDIQNADRVQNFDPSEFKKLYNEFYSEICGLHKNNPLLVGRANSGLPVKVFELDEKNSFAADFNINALYDYFTANKQEKRPDLVNPMIWSWQVMGFMELLKRFYEKKENAANIITKAELKSLEEVSVIGTSTLNFLHRVRNKELMQQLLHEHIKWGHELEHAITLLATKEEKLKTKELNQQLKKSMKFYSGSYSDSIFDDFKDQHIPFDTQLTDQWFTAESYNSHQNFGKVHGHHYSYGTATNIQQKIKDYKEERQLSVDQKKSELLQEARKRLVNFDNQFYYFNQYNLGNNYHYSFMYPQNPIHPILPLPKNILLPIPQTLQIAQWLQLGRVEFKYHIEQFEAKHAVGEVKEGLKAQNFVIETVWRSETDHKILSTLTMAYDPGIYGYKRVVMFAPLQKTLVKIDSKTILLHHNDGKLTAHWMVDNLKYSKSMLVTDAKDILAALPETGHESTNATLIRAIMTKFGCMPKENEALWWWWVGGKYCREGANYVSTVYSNTTHEQNTWTHEAYLPVCQETLGKRDTIKLDNSNSDKAELKVHTGEDSEFVRQIQQQISSKRMMLLENFYENLHKEINNNSVSHLGKALLHYSNSYYMLKSALSLTFGECVLKSYPEFKYFYDTTVLSHRHQLLSQLTSLGQNDISLLEKLKKDLQTCEAQVTEGLTKLFSEPHPDSLLALILKEWQELMNWYKQHSVDESPLCSSKSVAEMQQEQLKAYGMLLSRLSNVFAACSSETQLEIQQKMLKEGLVLTGNASEGAESKASDFSLGHFSIFSRQLGGPQPATGRLSKPIANSLATDAGIFATLKEKLGESVHIINPALSSVSNLFCDGQKAALEYVKEINIYLAEDKQELKKPIVAVLNTARAYAAHSADTEATGGSHWVTMVILPKNYKSLKNENEKIFLLDSLYPTRAVPENFKRILTQGGIHKFPAPVSEHPNAPIIEHEHKISAPFPNAEFVAPNEFKKQQIGATDCGWWAVDNVFKLLETGTISEVMKDYNGPRRADHLREQYPLLDKDMMRKNIPFIESVNKNPVSNIGSLQCSPK